jgi:hypothetical protein
MTCRMWNGGDYGGLAYLESQLFDFSKPLSDPFGIELTGTPDFDFQTAGVFGNTAYGTQDVNFDSSSLSTFAQKFFEANVTIDGQGFGPDSTLDVSQANIIDSLNYTGIDNGFSTQQLFLPAIQGTNVDNGVISCRASATATATTPSTSTWPARALGRHWGVAGDPLRRFRRVTVGEPGGAGVLPSYFDIGGFPADGLIPPTFDFLF